MHDQEGGENDASGDASRTAIRRWGKHPETGLHRLEFIHAVGLIDFVVGSGPRRTSSQREALSMLDFM